MRLRFGTFLAAVGERTTRIKLGTFVKHIGDRFASFREQSVRKSHTRMRTDRVTSWPT